MQPALTDAIFSVRQVSCQRCAMLAFFTNRGRKATTQKSSPPPFPRHTNSLGHTPPRPSRPSSVRPLPPRRNASDVRKPNLRTDDVTALGRGVDGVTRPTWSSEEVTRPSWNTGDDRTSARKTDVATRPIWSVSDVTRPNWGAGDVTRPTWSAGGITGQLRRPRYWRRPDITEGEVWPQFVSLLGMKRKKWWLLPGISI